MTRVITGSDGRKYLTDEPLLYLTQRDSSGAIIIPPKPVPVREEALF